MTYRTKTEHVRQTDTYLFTADGPGLGWQTCMFEDKDQAEIFARNLSQAFEAGKQARSREILAMLGGAEDTRRR